MKENKSVYIGGGFIDSQLLWIIPLVNGYCKNKKIKKIIFENKLNNKVKENFFVKNILKDYEVIYLKDQSIFLTNKFLKILLLLFYLTPLSIYKVLIFNKNKILEYKNNWKEYQINHSIWDTAMRNSNDGETAPKFFNLLKSSIEIFYNLYLSNLLKKKNVKDFFLGHSVYGYRAFLSGIREKGKKIFCHSGFTIYRQPINNDSSWCFVKKKKYINLERLVTKEKVNQYWKTRIKGFGNYEDSRIASSIKSKGYSLNNKNYNIIFLHIFRDSPFCDIDRDRIFLDYVSWVHKTIKIISKSKEKWILRLHPSYKRWGENQPIALKKILKSLFNDKISSNIIIEDNICSNHDVLRNARRIITFNGTSHLEAACYGIKPIIIANTMLNKIFPKLVFKAKSISEYSSLLLQNSNNKKFRLSKTDIFRAKKMMFIREKALKFETNIGGFHIFRGDPPSKLKKDFEETRKNLKKNINFLELNGKKLSMENDITLSDTFL